ncbi:MAG: hypothetical protein M0P43_06045 [Arcobacteraceae bacterium]|nr:hypothetical protein [Arcobacteraceae bacterium]
MKWEKKGLIYKPPFDGSWKDNSALTPTPFLLTEDIIRIYASFRDTNGIGRIGFVDVDANNPSIILRISEKPVLDIGQDGMFDDNGVILGDLIKIDNMVYMYYIGFQLVKKAKFLAYTGLAISNDSGETFVRKSVTPILDRLDNATLFNAVHTIMYENNIFKAWCGAGSAWQKINDIDYPSYIVQYYESSDGINFNTQGYKKCITFIENEYRIGRPRVYKDNNKYKMFYTYGTVEGKYEMGYAESNDGVNWNRLDSEIGITLSQDGWDSKSISYGVPIVIKDKVYMFYNGNEMGKEGFGYAELVQE